MTVERMAADAGYDRTRREHPWNGYDVWNVWNSNFEGCRTGYPHFVISDGVTMRFATFDEVKKIMRFENEIKAAAETQEG